jgi:hypothetical protein
MGADAMPNLSNRADSLKAGHWGGKQLQCRGSTKRKFADPIPLCRVSLNAVDDPYEFSANF